MSYHLLKKIAFCFDPETSHHLTLHFLSFLERLKLTHLFPKPIIHPKTVMGLDFPNIIGLAAGLDKNGDYIDALATLGFGFIEIGSITPRPQPGNPKPRLFRLTKESAIINRMGFNNKGVDYAVERFKLTRYRGILGINIGKNVDTPLEKALDDYLFVMKRVIAHASYITINISSPNTKGLRDLQQEHYLRTLLRELKKEQALYKARYVPLLIKISPDLTSHEISHISNIFLEEKVDGVIATNTSLSRIGIEASPFVNESGGLSGKPIFELSTHVLREFHRNLKDVIPIIGCGGITDKQDAINKITAGASLLQVYSGLIYEGPKLVRDIARSMI